MYETMRKQLFLIFTACFSFVFSTYAQDSVKVEAKTEKPVEKTEFVPGGKVEGKIFADFHSVFEGDESEYAFDVTRAYFGYKYEISENFTAKVKLDFGHEDFLLVDGSDTTAKTKLFAYVKNANVKYKKGNFELNFGLIDLYQHKAAESQWGYRYIYKSFQDKHGFSKSADLGVNFKYKFIDQVSADLSISNGEGYKSLQTDEYFKTGLGINIVPVEHLLVRIYGDFMPESDSVTSASFSGFAGYNLKGKFRIGAEYAYKANPKGKVDHTISGLSAYTTYYIMANLNVFARYDFVTSNQLDGEDDIWNADDDGSAVIGGFEFVPVKNVNLSVNAQYWKPYLDDVDSELGIYLNTQIKF